MPQVPFSVALDLPRGENRVLFHAEDGAGARGTSLIGSPIPASVLGDRRYVKIALGARHACALTEAGEAWCWGANQDGQLGNGAQTPFLGAGSGNPTPSRVATDVRFVAIAAGRGHTCGLTDEGEAYCWGFNHEGQLGTGVGGRP